MLAWPGNSLGQSLDAARAAARQLANDGVADYQSGSYRAASEKLERAFATVKAPSIGLWSARALVKAGHLVQASERYLEVTRLDAKQGDEAVQKQAQADATREYDELQPRIPTLTVQISGQAPGDAVQVTIDGAPLTASLLGAPVPTDPGEHAIKAKHGARVVKAHVTLLEGKHEQVELQLDTASASPPSAKPVETQPAAAAPERVAAPAAPAPPPPVAAANRHAVPAATWAAVGVSVVGIAVGTVTGLMAKSQRDELSPRCPNDVCDPADRNAVNQMNTLRTVSSIGFVVGGVGLAGAGITFFALRGEPKQAGVLPLLRTATLSVQGAF